MWRKEKTTIFEHCSKPDTVLSTVHSLFNAHSHSRRYQSLCASLLSEEISSITMLVIDTSGIGSEPRAVWSEILSRGLCRRHNIVSRELSLEELWWWLTAKQTAEKGIHVRIICWWSSGLSSVTVVRQIYFFSNTLKESVTDAAGWPTQLSFLVLFPLSHRISILIE